MLIKTLTALATGIIASFAAQAAQPEKQTASSAQTAARPIATMEVENVVLGLADALEQNFVFPEIGNRYSAMLRTNLQAGKYAALTDAEFLAEAVTADLQAEYPDGHLRLFAPQIAGKKSKYRTTPTADGAIGRAGWISPGVAYIELTMFPSDPDTLGKLRAFLDAHGSAHSLIIDLRGHHGGDIGEIDVIGSYLFSEPTELAQLDTRAAVDAAGGSPFEDGPTLRRVEAPYDVVRRSHVVTPVQQATGLVGAKVFVLTSSRTVSAAEHLAMGLKTTGRATLIGEVTRGAGNYGDTYPIAGGYSAFIPNGRTFDPATGKGWEGVGIAPDVPVPADQALAEALKLAGAPAASEVALTAL